MIYRNTPFQCLNCAAQIPPLKKSCRNHCSQCLCSQHVDLKVPGDRDNPCRGLMKPVGLDSTGKKGKMIIHECIKCHMRTRTKVAPDDTLETILSLLS